MILNILRLHQQVMELILRPNCRRTVGGACGSSTREYGRGTTAALRCRFHNNINSCSTDFGNLSVARSASTSSNSIRGVTGGGTDSNSTTIDYFTIAILGNAQSLEI